MNRDDLQLFMTMFEEQNLMRAAELLYLSPSTAGARLRAMEDELGFELFERRKGVKASVPTPKGVEFSRIAAQMLSLWNEADQLSRRHESPHLSIATVDSFLDYNLTPLYRDLVSLHGFSLDIKCYPADMIYSLVSQKQADVGFALNQASMPHVKVTPVMSDDMVLVVPKGMSPDGELQPDGELPPSISPASLPPEKELLTGSPFNNNIGWGPEFKVWHDRYIGPSHRPLVTASSISILTGFLEMEDYWTVMPATTARGLMGHAPIRILTLDPAPPRRTLYLLTHQSPTAASAENTELFCGYLREFLEGKA